MKRPETTLFMLMSVDGKVSVGTHSKHDLKDYLHNNPHTSIGLQQYYTIESEINKFFLTTGKALSESIPVVPYNAETQAATCVLIVDGYTTSEMIVGICNRYKKVILCGNISSPVILDECAQGISYTQSTEPALMLKELTNSYGCEELVIRSDSNYSDILLRHHLIDKIDILVAPVLIGGCCTPTLLDGKAFRDSSEFGELVLTDLAKLKDSWVRLSYDVVNRKE